MRGSASSLIARSRQLRRWTLSSFADGTRVSAMTTWSCIWVMSLLGPIAESIPLTASLNGRKFLVPGNHDRVSPATQSRAAIERFTPLYEQAGWTLLPEVIEGTRHGTRVLGSHYPYAGDTQDSDRHTSHRPVDRGIPLLHGHTHDRTNGPVGHQYHVGVDAFDYAPIPFSLIDAWLQDLGR